MNNSLVRALGLALLGTAGRCFSEASDGGKVHRLDAPTVQPVNPVAPFVPFPGHCPGGKVRTPGQWVNQRRLRTRFRKGTKSPVSTEPKALGIRPWRHALAVNAERRTVALAWRKELAFKFPALASKVDQLNEIGQPLLSGSALEKAIREAREARKADRKARKQAKRQREAIARKANKT